ncbi:hypothetical protein AB0J74_28245 [Asanoa sp. NPDC049573]|uniref:hypothetical protein n=1 Tax=Asanoa sp. NPDC049573 TaxID=3155396 RepID=UPI00344286A0
MDHRGLLPIHELEQQRMALAQAVADQQADLESRRLRKRAALDHDALLATESSRRDHERVTAELAGPGRSW